MNFWGCATLLILCSTTALHAQVRELWRSTITNSVVFGSTNYLMNDAVVDVEGNTIVGGRLVVGFNAATHGGFIAKFDAAGNPVWEFAVELPLRGAFESLVTDADGNVFFTFSLGPIGRTTQVVLVKLSPDGREIWRIIQNNVASTHKPTALKSDRDGNVFMTALLARNLSPSEFVTEWQVMKLDPEGRVLWRTMIPHYGYFSPSDMNSSRTLALTEEGGVVMTGSYIGVLFPTPTIDPVGFVAKLDARGRVDWWTIGHKGNEKPGYHSVGVGSKGIICAAGSGGTVFSRNGQALHTSSSGSVAAGGVVAGVTSNGGFLLRNASFLYAIRATGGKERWGIQPMDMLWDVLPDGTDSWLGVGGENHIPYRIQFARINQEGRREWIASLPANPLTQSVSPYSDSGRPSVLRAPDGTVRIVGQVPFNSPFAQSGIAVLAFTLE